MDALAGVTVTATGGRRVIVAVAVFVESDWLVTVRTTVCVVEIVAGAVYMPLCVMLPAVEGFKVYVTEPEHPLSDWAVNCCV